MIARIALIVLALIMNYFVLDIYFETKNTPQAIGGTMYMLLFWIITMIIAICTCYFTGFKKLTKTDFVLLSLCTPLSSMIVILLS
jgi:heme/copper-type cytochrome/quinol oxidase subunit 2